MSDIFEQLSRRSQQHETELDDAFTKPRNFCIREIPKLGHSAIIKMQETEFRQANIDHTAIELSDGMHAAWQLAEWPPYELPRKVIEKYEVLLLDTGDVMSLTTHWPHMGGTILEPYDPMRYELPSYNARTIYSQLANLPGDPEFKETYMDRYKASTIT